MNIQAHFFNMSSEKSKEKEKYEYVCPSKSDSDESIVFEQVTNGKFVAQKVSQFDQRNNIHNRILDLTLAFHSSPGKYISEIDFTLF